MDDRAERIAGAFAPKPLPQALQAALRFLEAKGGVDSDDPNLSPGLLASLRDLARRELVLHHGYRKDGVRIVRYEPKAEEPGRTVTGFFAGEPREPKPLPCPVAEASGAIRLDAQKVLDLAGSRLRATVAGHVSRLADADAFAELVAYLGLELDAPAERVRGVLDAPISDLPKVAAALRLRAARLAEPPLDLGGGNREAA